MGEAPKIKIEVETTTTHEEQKLEYSWDELVLIAKAISNNRSINSQTAEVTVNGATIGVGDYTTIKYPDSENNLVDKKVRIIGFNHDDLSTDEETTATGKAGITFEFVTALAEAKMNETNTGAGGWATSALRNNMGTYLNLIEQNNSGLNGKIKKVVKKYNTLHDDIDIQTVEDNLWLLACSEIWNTGYDVSKDISYAISKGTQTNNEGNRYRYYEMVIGNTNYGTSLEAVKRYSSYDFSSNASITTAKVWLRSRDANGQAYLFACTGTDATCHSTWASNTGINIAPAFCI